MSDNLDQLLSDFTQNPFALQETSQTFRDILVRIFPEIHFSDLHTQSLDGDMLKSYTHFANSLKLGNDELGIAIFECGSIKAKVGLHTELKSLLKSSPLNAILAIFYTQDFAEFRLSLITKTYNLATDKLTYSNLKRQSFVLGQPKVATAHNALKKLIDTATKSRITLKDLESTFSKEVISDEFYKGYEKHYKDICQKLKNANLDNVFASYRGTNDSIKAIESFAKKLLGRIVFLYFLQKKGWLGVPKDAEYGSGDLGFLHKLFCKAQQNDKNFYATYLCPLFFDSLNSHKENDYSALFDCKIPFLNGGLFEDEFSNSSIAQKAHFLIANILDNATFREIFDFFESYNFTIEESTPTDTEVSIDPEMLGKVFENLIDYNKASGAFYTPREIVHYMCQSALISHFLRFYPEHRSDIENLILHHQSDSDFIRTNGSEIKSKLLNLKILDPAIGSGAFPMGLLLEIMQVLESLDKTMSYEARASHKRDIIARCIYGIDIDSGAIEIAKLRFWLSIAVDEVRPSPLPNLDFKFMQGNSLLECLTVGKETIEIIPKDFMKDLQPSALFDANEGKVLFQGDTAKELQNLFLEYYAQSDCVKKQSTKAKIIQIMQSAFDAQIARIAQDIDLRTKELQNYPLNPSAAKKRENLSNQIESLMAQSSTLQSLAKDFIDNDFHTDKLFLYNFFFANIISEGGFDIVIGNPPYIRQESIPNKQAILQAYKSIDLLGKSYAFSSSTADIYTYFFAKGAMLLSPKDNLIFITSNKFCRAGYGKNLREFLLGTTIQKYVDFNGVKVFDNATVDSCICQICKEIPKDNMIAYATPTKKDLSTLAYSQIPQDSLSGEAFIFADSPTLALKQKIEKIGTPLKEWDIEINYGIKTGYNEAFIIDTATKDRILDSCESMAEKERTAQIIKPILRGRDIKRYSYEWANLWLINAHNGYSLPNGEKIPRIDINNYPALKKHLDKFYPQLQKRTDKGATPYNLRNCAYVEDFEKEKISWQRVTQEPSFIIEKDFYLLDSMAFLVSDSKQELRYLLAFLNSKAVFWYFKNIGHLYSDKGFLLSNQYVSRFPIPKINTKNQNIVDKIVNLVDKVLESKKQGKDSATPCHTEHSEVSQKQKRDLIDSSLSTKAQNDKLINDLESQIDDLVYQLYELDSHEIQIIKSK